VGSGLDGPLGIDVVDTEPANSSPRARAWAAPSIPTLGGYHTRLRVLSYNIQVGVDISRYRHYVTHSWKHVFPYKDRLENLDRIASLIRTYNLVGLQEVDRGSLRSGFIDQTEYLAHKGRFTYWYSQATRSLGKIAQHSNGFLSHIPPDEVTEHRLPGLRGRGALMAQFGRGYERLTLFTLHLALGRRARMRQLYFLAELVSEHPHVILLGDLNCQSSSPEMRWFMRRTGLQGSLQGLPTFPSWRPLWHLDHILVSPSLQVEHVHVLNYPFSDHLPIAMEVCLPFGMPLAA
jgi:endonuclease/exonuclease/phosphatase family metal-dependent hydrolase